MSFSCPNYDMDRDRCWRLDSECVPGRVGCVLRGNSKFAVPAEERVRQRTEEEREEFPPRNPD